MQYRYGSIAYTLNLNLVHNNWWYDNDFSVVLVDGLVQKICNSSALAKE